MKRLIAITLASFMMLFGATSCSQFSYGPDGFHLPWATLPVEFGAMYELEEDVFIIVETGVKGGINIRLEGEGDVNEHLSIIDGGFEFHSPWTGITYQILSGENGKVKIMIVAENGKLKLYTPKKVNAADPVVETE